MCRDNGGDEATGKEEEEEGEVMLAEIGCAPVLVLTGFDFFFFSRISLLKLLM